MEYSFLEYRLKALIAVAKNNVSVLAIASIIKDLVNEYAETNNGGGCYHEYGATFDGTPLFQEAEALVIRAVTKD